MGRLDSKRPTKTSSPLTPIIQYIMPFVSVNLGKTYGVARGHFCAICIHKSKKNKKSSQYQPKANTPEATKIHSIFRKLARKVPTLLLSFSKNPENFRKLQVRSILRERIFREKSLKGEVICGYCKTFRRIITKNTSLKTYSI